jgi:hypothetical protein
MMNSVTGIHMRSSIVIATAGFALLLSGAAYADQATSQDAVPSPISYSSNDGPECHHLVHQGMVTSIVECRDQAGWERQRHMMTQQEILMMQIHSDIQIRR